MPCWNVDLRDQLPLSVLSRRAFCATPHFSIFSIQTKNVAMNKQQYLLVDLQDVRYRKNCEWNNHIINNVLSFDVSRLYLVVIFFTQRLGVAHIYSNSSRRHMREVLDSLEFTHAYTTQAVISLFCIRWNTQRDCTSLRRSSHYGFSPTLRTLCTLLVLSGALSHMQEPSPLGNPCSDTTDEPKDYKILTPLHSDRTDYACEGYQWGTPLTSIATYQAGETYQLKLRDGAAHDRGSCQVSLSCNNGVNLKAIKSIMGGCPNEKEYGFKIPAYAKTAQCLLIWTWWEVSSLKKFI